MQNVQFRAARSRATMRRKTRLKRTLFWLSVASVAATILGVPGTDSSLNPFSRLAGYEAQGSHPAMATVNNTADVINFRRKVFDSRPLPKRPDPQQQQASSSTDATLAAPAPASSNTIVGDIYQAAGEFGLSSDYLLSVAECESGLDPYAVNAAGYYGLFQFDYTTWNAYGYGSIYDPAAQARTAARLLAAGQSSRWPNCA